jgi:hypothetical protein
MNLYRFKNYFEELDRAKNKEALDKTLTFIIQEEQTSYERNSLIEYGMAKEKIFHCLSYLKNPALSENPIEEL